jgi:hypothetical protein
LPHPLRGQLLLQRVLRKTRGEPRKVDLVDGLVLVEAGENVGDLPVSGSRCGCRHCAQISFIMHCIGELIDAMA